MFTGTVRDITQRKQAELEREELLSLEQISSLDAREAATTGGHSERVADAVTDQAPTAAAVRQPGAGGLLGFESARRGALARWRRS